MITIDDIKLYLPKYLSPESEQSLFDELKHFPDNIDYRLYTNYLNDSDIIYQGDGIKDLLIINLPDVNTKKSPAMVVSNTCDTDISNIRFFTSNIVYAPIFNLEKYRMFLLTENIKNEASINQHIISIKKQYITQIFYLPKYGPLEQDSIVFLDRLNNCDSEYICRSHIPELRIFTLSNYGLYLFLFKLSVHFTRIGEKIDRKVAMQH